MNKYNLQKLIRVSTHNGYVDVFVTWKPKKTFLGITIRKEGTYSFLGNEREDPDPETHVLRNGVWWVKPHLTLWFQDDHSKTIYFNTRLEADEEAQKYLTDTFI